MIIDELLQTIDSKDNLYKLKQICNKMVAELGYAVKYFDDSSNILYYYKFDYNEYFSKYLVLSFDILDKDIYYIDVYSEKKSNNDDILNEFKKIKSTKINAINVKNILIEYGTILKRLLKNE